MLCVCVCGPFAPRSFSWNISLGFPKAKQNDLTFHVTSRTTPHILFQTKQNIHGNWDVLLQGALCVYLVIIHLMKINEGVAQNGVGRTNTGRVLRLGAAASKQTISSNEISSVHQKTWFCSTSSQMSSIKSGLLGLLQTVSADAT